MEEFLLVLCHQHLSVVSYSKLVEDKKIGMQSNSILEFKEHSHTDTDVKLTKIKDLMRR